MSFNRKRGGPFQFQGDDTGPDGFHEITQPGFSQATTLADLQRHVRNLYDCEHLYHHINACRVGGMTADEILDEDPDAATAVEDETSFGISPAVGTSLAYAREDHTHGTPANPVDGTEVKAASVIPDNAIVAGDGGARGVQDSGFTISDLQSFEDAIAALGDYATVDFADSVVHTGDFSAGDLGGGDSLIDTNVAGNVLTLGNGSTKIEMPGTLDPKVIWMPKIAESELDDPAEDMIALYVDETGAFAAKDENGDPVALVPSSTLETLIAAYLTANPPSGTVTGTIIMFGSATPPTGFLACDGAAVSRTTYAALFAVIGTTWGAGDESTTFNVPDLRNKFPVGSGDAYAANDDGGAATVTLTAAQSGLPQHTHTQDSHNHTQDAHTHTQDAHLHTQGAGTGSTGNFTQVTTAVDTSSGGTGATPTQTALATRTANATATNQNATATNQAATATNQNAGPSGAAEAHENLPPYLAVPFCIKT